MGVVYEGMDDDQGKAMQKGQIWTANFDLSLMSVRCRTADCLHPTTHDHRHIRGGHKIEGEGWMSVARRSGKYSRVQAAVYATCIGTAILSRGKDPPSYRKDGEMWTGKGVTALASLASSTVRGKHATQEVLASLAEAPKVAADVGVKSKIGVALANAASAPDAELIRRAADAAADVLIHEKDITEADRAAFGRTRGSVEEGCGQR